MDYRFALVTDVEWVAKTMHMFAWMTAGGVMIVAWTGSKAERRVAA